MSLLSFSNGANAQPYQPDASGQVVIEVEHFDLNVSQGGRNWIEDFTPGFVGDSAMLADPDSFLSVKTNIAGNSPRMDYEIEFAGATTLNIWVRGLGRSGSRDSIWVGVDGDDSTVRRVNPTRGAYGWEPGDGQLNVPAGVHTINIWMREDGTIVDRLLLTPLSITPSGDGPAESMRGGDPGNTFPIAADDSFSVAENSSSNALAVFNNNGNGVDFDPDNDPIDITSADNPGSTGGTIVINGNNDGLIYTPVANFAGIETFDYTISDGRGGSATATVTVTVNNTTNNPPVLNSVGNRSATENQALTFTVTASDPDGAPLPTLSADLSQLSGNPSFTNNGNGTGSFSWTPSVGDAPGPYSVTFTATDAVNSALTSSETISVSVQSAGSGGGSGAYQPDGTGQVVIEVEHFDLNVSQGGRNWIEDFTPGFVGDSAMLADPDSFLSVKTNIAGNSPRMDYEIEFASATTLNIWVRGLGLSGSRDSIWVGVDGDDSTVRRVNPTRGAYGWEPGDGQLSVPAGVHTINIWMREDGTIVDRLLLTPQSITPSGDGPPESMRGGDPGNTFPIAADDSFSVAENSSSNALAVFNNNGNGVDFDPDNDPIDITSADNPGSAGGTIIINGSADGLVYTPAANFAGVETFDYTISDGHGGSATATVTVTVNNSTNNPPVLNSVGNRSATESQALTFTVTASDPDGAPLPTLSADLSQLSRNPSFTDNGNGTGSFSWTPSVGDAPGPYAVTFTATDAVNSALTSSETISINVQAAGGSGGSGAYQPDGSGQVVIEVEHFDLNVSQGGRNWIEDFTPGFVGDSAMLADPDSFLSVKNNIAANSPRMDYEVEFASATTLNIWVRGLGLSGSRDSIWVGVDGDDSTVRRVNPTRGTYGWETGDGQLNVPAGVHTINIWMREDGTIVDRLLLTPQSITPSGDGPPESSRGNGGGGSGLPITDNFSDGNSAGWTTVDDSTQFPSNWSVNNQAFVQSAHTNSSGKDVTETYHRGSYAYLTASANLDDYRLAVDVTPDDEGADDIGVMFRYSNNNNYYRFSINSLNGFARLESKLNGTYLTLARNLRGFTPGELQNIVVVAEGALIQVFVNDDPLFAVRDTDHSSGGIALYSRDNSSFDNVAITTPDTSPSVVISSPVAHTVLPNGPLDLTVTAIARNVPANNGNVSFQYRTGGSPILCNAATEQPTGVFTALCPGVPVGDYTVEALLLNNGAEIRRDSNVSVAIGSQSSGSHRYDAFGNSITRGVGDNYATDNLNLNDQRSIGVSGWPALLGDLLSDATGSPNLVANEGISGDRATHTRTERLFSIIERQPDSDRALIMLGTNDSNNFNTTPVATLVADIQAIIDTLHANGRDTVYLAQLPPAWGNNTSTAYADPLDPSATRNQTIISYNAAIQSMLPQQGVLPGPDLFSCFLTPSVNRFSLFTDSLHPNALGHAMIAGLWRDAIVSGPVSPCPVPIFILESLDSYQFGHKQNLLEAGDRYYNDESFTLTNVPSELENGIWVMPSNAFRTNANANFLSFDIGNNPATVYIAYDPAGNPPTSSTHAFGSVNLSSNISVSDSAVGNFAVVRANNVSGTIGIGGNKSGGGPAQQQSYLVIVVP